MNYSGIMDSPVVASCVDVKVVVASIVDTLELPGVVSIAADMGTDVVLEAVVVASALVDGSVVAGKVEILGSSKFKDWSLSGRKYIEL